MTCHSLGALLKAEFQHQTGNVIGQAQRRHRSTKFRTFIDTVEYNLPKDLEIHFFLDNYGTHKINPIAIGRPMGAIYDELLSTMERSSNECCSLQVYSAT